MSHTALHRPTPAGWLIGGPSSPEPACPPAADAVAMEQLRHLTKNALQRIIAQIAASGLRATPEGSRLADDLEDRICLSARISDALFGLTAQPGTLPQRLARLAESTVAMLADPEQAIRADVCVTGTCPAGLESTLLQVAHEMIGNAVKHGMRLRPAGQIAIRLRARGPGHPGEFGTTLRVSDDGWGPGQFAAGRGMAIMRRLVGQHGGTATLCRTAGWTVAQLHLPPDAADRAPARG